MCSIPFYTQKSKRYCIYSDRLILSGMTSRTKHKRMENWQKCNKIFIKYSHKLTGPTHMTSYGYIFAPWFKMCGTTYLFNMHLEKVVSADVVTLSRGFLATTRDLFASDIQARLQTFRVRWTQGECCALIQEAPWQMDNNIEYAGLVHTRDSVLMVCCA